MLCFNKMLKDAGFKVQDSSYKVILRLKLC